MKQNSLLLLAAFFIFFGCASTDPKLKAEVDAVHSSSPQKSDSYEKSEALKAPDLKVGQWTKYIYKDKKDRPGVYVYKIVGEKDGAYWYETEMIHYTGTSLMKILMKPDFENYENTEIIRVINMHGDSDPSIVEGPALDFTKGLYRKLMKSMFLEWSIDNPEDVTVKAGTFNGAYKTNSKVSFGFITMEGTGWYHSEVPINGMIKTKDDKGFSMELIDFGHTGATSKIPVE